jgi:hypothetical protein
MPRDSITIRHSATGRGLHLEAEQLIAARRDMVFALFSDAFKLEQLTPA